jgi:hypothetical protein
VIRPDSELSGQGSSSGKPDALPIGQVHEDIAGRVIRRLLLVLRFFDEARKGSDQGGCSVGEANVDTGGASAVGTLHVQVQQAVPLHQEPEQKRVFLVAGVGRGAYDGEGLAVLRFRGRGDLLGWRRMTVIPMASLMSLVP